MPLIRSGQQRRYLAGSIVNVVFLAEFHALASYGAPPGEDAVGEDGEAAADCWLWWRESKSSTHNESRLAACPLSGIPGRVRAPVN
jgi:hypothetical protein